MPKRKGPVEALRRYVDLCDTEVEEAVLEFVDVTVPALVRQFLVNLNNQHCHASLTDDEFKQITDRMKRVYSLPGAFDFERE
jgi:hypothetical protein